MARVVRISGLPGNFREFAREISEGIGETYGPEAAREYLDRAGPLMRRALANPDVDALVARVGGEPAGMLMAHVRDGIAHISLIHVLTPYRQTNAESALLRESVRTLRNGGVEGVLSEFVAVYPDHLEPVYAELGFEAFPRELMIADAHAPELRVDDAEVTEQARARHLRPLANAMARAYVDHPGRRLHDEVRDPARARGFVRRVLSGAYGRTRREFNRVIHADGTLAGGAFGCIAAPDVGFVLHVFVDPAFQGQGLGGRLVREQAREFRRAGLDRAALGVTSDNPARRLYERLGFRTKRQVVAHSWWRER